jgi:hypothetical protein
MSKRYFVIIVALSCFHSAIVFGKELFVRPDGGTFSQCSGEVNQPFDAALNDRNCAVSHPFELLHAPTQEVRINGGDIITILNHSDGTVAEYEMGRHATYTEDSCNASWNYSCTMPGIPGGSATAPTIIRGADCNNKPVLWGSGRARNVVTIKDNSNIELSCLTITDKSSCVAAAGYPDSSLVCNRSAPYDKPFADTGIFMLNANNITLEHIDIKGLATGIHAGKISDTTLRDVHLFANSFAGWNGDVNYESHAGSSNSGTILFKDSSINFSGCGLVHAPGQSNHDQPHACAKQDLGGYGDALGTANTGGDWVFDNTTIMHNASDGIDLLYHVDGGKVTVKNSRIEGNSGNQLKVSGNTDIFNNIIISTCGWFASQDPALGAHGEICRAVGTAIVMNYSEATTTVNLVNNSVFSQGDCILTSGNRGAAGGSQQQRLSIVNNIFYAGIDYYQKFENSCLYYTDAPFPLKEIHSNMIHLVKPHADPCNAFDTNTPANYVQPACTSTQQAVFDDSDYSILSNPQFLNLNLTKRYSAYDLPTLHREANQLRLSSESSPAINSGFSGVLGSGFAIPTTDFSGLSRGGAPDIGAHEFQTTTAIPLPPANLQITIH